jgi:hypothetical protein
LNFSAYKELVYLKFSYQYLNVLGVMEEGGPEWKRKFVELFQVSQQHLEEGSFVFRKIKDNVNVALLSCNLAKLHRLQARALAPVEKKEASLAEWKCYSKV